MTHETFQETLAEHLATVAELIEDEETKNSLESMSEELSELKEEEPKKDSGKKVGEIVKKAIAAIAAVAAKTDDDEVKKALEKVIKWLKSVPGYPYPAEPKKKSNSNMEENKMELEKELSNLKEELEQSKSELSEHLAKVDELKDIVLAKDKELSDMKEELSSVTESKDTAETELAKIEQEKKDAELSEHISNEIKVGLTKEEDRESRLEALRVLNDDGLQIYKEMLAFQLEAVDAESAKRKTLDDEEPDPSDEKKEKEELKKQLEKAFGLKQDE